MKNDNEKWFLLGVMTGFFTFLIFAIALVYTSKEDAVKKKPRCNEYHITVPRHGPSR